MASALELFVNTVTSLSDQENYTELVKYLAKSRDILTKNISLLDTVLATLQPSVHTLGVLAVLKVRLQHTTYVDSNIDTLHATVAEFISVCSDEQIKYSPCMMGELCSSYTSLLISGKCAMRGLESLQTAILKIRESPLHLTSVHSNLVHLCLVSKCFKPALKFMDVDLIDIGKESGYFTVEHFLLYYYYGGMIYTAVKQYEKAQYFFQVCISTPAMSVSHIMLEAFKKYLLVSLILDGKIEKLPKYASLVVCRFIKPLSQPYLELGKAYATNNPEKVNVRISKHQDVFIRDQNMGLVKQCIHALYKSNIQRLTRTFLTLSLADVANRVHLATPQEAQKYILNMIKDGEIHASINQKDGMVVFNEKPETYNSLEMLKRIDDELKLCMSIDKQVTLMEEEIMTSPQYVEKVLGPQDEEQMSQSGSQQSQPSSSGFPSM